MNEELKTQLIDWSKSADNTNEYCERSILVDAIIESHKDNPDIQKIRKRLLQLVPSEIKGGKKIDLIEPPDFCKND